jgi:exopolyphosphatase/guanosine-5'-triphosphate,3'-diphosphate pyrophosphatase
MRLGVLDIGSNTVHLLLVDAHPGARPVPYGSHKRGLQLVAFLDEDGAINEQGQRELIDFITEAAAFAADNNAEEVLAFATSAIRESANGQAVLDRVHAETGILLQELTGPEEAAATFLAVRRWYGWGSGRILGLDIGGGSFEIAIGGDENPDLALSVPLGAGRMTRDFLEGDPPTAKSIKSLRKHIRGLLEEPIEQIMKLEAPHIAAGTSKSFRSLARIAGAAPRGAGLYVNRELRLTDLSLWTTRMAAMSSSDRSELPGVSATRAPQMLSAALVAEAAMEGFGLETMGICPWALREGILLKHFDQLMTT